MPDYKDINKQEFGHNLVIERMLKGMSQRELAEKVGIHFQELYRYEKGIRMPRDAVLNKIAEVLDVDPYSLKYGYPYEGYMPPFYSEPIGKSFGKKYTLEHIYNTNRNVSIDSISEKLQKLSDEDLRVIDEMAAYLYLDSHPEEYEKIVQKREKSFEKDTKALKADKKGTEIIDKTHDLYHDDLYKLFPEKYDEFLEAKKSSRQIDSEIWKYVNENHPDLIDKLYENDKIVDIVRRIIDLHEDDDYPTPREKYRAAKYVHNKIVPELYKRLLEDEAKNGRTATPRCDYEETREEHDNKMIREKKLKLFREEYFDELYERGVKNAEKRAAAAGKEKTE